MLSWILYAPFVILIGVDRGIEGGGESGEKREGGREQVNVHDIFMLLCCSFHGYLVFSCIFLKVDGFRWSNRKGWAGGGGRVDEGGSGWVMSLAICFMFSWAVTETTCDFLLG